MICPIGHPFQYILPSRTLSTPLADDCLDQLLRFLCRHFSASCARFGVGAPWVVPSCLTATVEVCRDEFLAAAEDRGSGREDRDALGQLLRGIPEQARDGTEIAAVERMEQAAIGEDQDFARDARRALRAVNVLGRGYLASRLSGVHDWPILRVHRGTAFKEALKAFPPVPTSSFPRFGIGLCWRSTTTPNGTLRAFPERRQ